MRITIIIAALIIIIATVCTGHTGATTQDPPPPATLMSQADLEEMLGPIALYPDSLLASVLAACVYPDELVAADQYIKGGGSVAGIAEQKWEQPVKSIAKVPEALDFLADNIEWSTAVGEVYIAQSKDVMTAVQSLRAKAKTNGALESSEQMTVVQSGSNVIIEPAQPDVVYVPQYNPQVVYVDEHHDNSGDALVGGMIGFGAGLLVGEIFDDNDDWGCDWDGGHVGWGHNDVDIDRNVERGDVNIERGDVNVDNSRTNNIGREGQKWEPNTQKVQEREARTGGTRASDEFRGVSDKSAASRSMVPSKTSAAKTRESAKPLNANNGKPAITSAADRGERAAKTPMPATRTPPSRPAPSSAAPKTPNAGPKSPSRPPTPKTPAPTPRGGGGGGRGRR